MESSAEMLGTSVQDFNVIASGDFNSLPNSGTIEFLLNRDIPTAHREFKKFNYGKFFAKCFGDPNEVRHSFEFASAYYGNIMPFTNYT